MYKIFKKEEIMTGNVMVIMTDSTIFREIYPRMNSLHFLSMANNGIVARIEFSVNML